MATKYFVKLWDDSRHKVRSLKQATVLTRGEPFIAQKLLRQGKKSPILRKYEILGTMAHCVATKAVK